MTPVNKKLIWYLRSKRELVEDLYLSVKLTRIVEERIPICLEHSIYCTDTYLWWLLYKNLDKII